VNDLVCSKQAKEGLRYSELPSLCCIGLANCKISL